MSAGEVIARLECGHSASNLRRGVCRTCGYGELRERLRCDLRDGRRICVQCGKNPAADRYIRCARCRGAEFDLCACGEQKTKKAGQCQQCRHASPLTGEEHPAWKGGRVQLKDGYVRIYMPEHPRAVNGRYVLEHIHVMEQALGRYLFADEQVHHRNKIRNDNRPENLELWSIGHPAGARVEDLVTWAREVLVRYGN